MRKTFIASLAVAALAVCAGSANAAPAGVPNHDTSGGWITKVAIGDCQRDDRGWHRMRGARRENCRPARPAEGGKLWGWKCEGPRCGWWHSKEKHWHDS
jgi:hypothetical protein